MHAAAFVDDPIPDDGVGRRGARLPRAVVQFRRATFGRQRPEPFVMTDRPVDVFVGRFVAVVDVVIDVDHQGCRSIRAIHP
jgi:hypothetical protein